MDINAIEQILWDAVERGALTAEQVDEVVVQMRGADTDLAEALAATQDRYRRVAQDLEALNHATSSAVRLLNTAANN